MNGPYLQLLIFSYDGFPHCQDELMLDFFRFGHPWCCAVSMSEVELRKRVQPPGVLCQKACLTKAWGHSAVVF
jgi:hypothetical protein